MRGLTVEQLVEAEERRDVVHAALDLGLGRVTDAETEPEVLAHAHVRIQRVVLEDHRDVAVGRRQLGDLAIADRDRPVRDLLEAGDHAKQRRLAAAGRPDEHHELAVLDRQVDVVDGDDAAGERLRDVLE